MPTTPAPFAIALPKGLGVSGISTWALRLAAGLAARPRRVTLIVHTDDAVPGLPPAVDVVRIPGGARLADALPVYRDAVRRLSDGAGAPVVLSPSYLGDCYGLAAALCVTESERVRIVGIQHADIEYDARVLTHYEQVISRFVGVSERIAAALRDRLPARASDVAHLPYGVEIPQRPPAREPLAGRAVRLFYTGRIEHDQKRIRALVHLSDELSRRNIEHELTLLGDGPAAQEIDALIASRPRIRRIAAVAPSAVSAHLDRADAFVLASRWEGLSVSMLEAMSRACPPIAVGEVSGAGEAVKSGENGVLVDAAFDAPEDSIGRALADGVETFLASHPERLARNAHETARTRFSIETHAHRWGALIDAAAAAPARSWPFDRRCAFTAPAGGAPSSEGSGAVPPDGPARLRELLRTLAGRRIALHGAGRHTIELAPILAESPAHIVAITDDDPGRHGEQFLGWTITAPAHAAESGATDVVLSSWMHAEAMWRRREVFERQSLHVHRAYPPRARSKPPQPNDPVSSAICASPSEI